MNETILTIIENAEQKGLSSFGVRVETLGVKVGSELNNSDQFGDTWENEELDGTCALTISYDGFEVEDIEYDIEQLNDYLVENCQIVLIGGTESYEGTDANETVIKNAVVLHIF